MKNADGGIVVELPTAPPGVNPAEFLIQKMIFVMGDDPARPGLKDTPKRVLKAWAEMFGGYKEKPLEQFKVFEEATSVQEMIVVNNIPFTSFCEHHLLPFTGEVHFGYIPGRSATTQKFVLAGLSKFARLVNVYSRRLQIQERMTAEMAATMLEALKPLGCGVIVEAHHGCMSCRGVKTPNSKTITSSLHGCFREPQVRQEFFHLTERE